MIVFYGAGVGGEPVAVGLRVELLRREARLTQAQLAARAGVSRVTVCYLEQGRGRARMRTLEAVGEALGVSVEELLGEAPLSSGGRVPGVWVEAVFRVSCEVCGPLGELNDVDAAARLRAEHAVPHPSR